jgi:cyclopropane fatty-acyl-phospholipid synthase-like methyltransferase
MAAGMVHTTDDLLCLLDSLFPDPAEWWDTFFTDREKPVPFFANVPDENLAAYFDSHRLLPGRVLELGCGAGRNALFAASRGCAVDAVDISPQAIEWATERMADSGLSVEFICASILDFRPKQDGYDIVYDAGCLHHLPPHRRMAYMEVVRRALRPSGMFALTCFTSEGGSGLSDKEAYERRSLGGGLGFSEEQLRGLFERDFEMLELRRMRNLPPESGLYGEEFLWAALMRMKSVL